MISRTSTTAITTPVTTAIPSVARRAAGVGAGILIVAFIYAVLKIASLATGGG